MLSRYRVLDLTDERAHVAGFMLAALGAEVICVEPPEGAHSRSVPPFAGDISLVHWAYNRGKRSVVGGPAEIDALAASADVVLHCGAVEADLAALRAANPRLVTVNVTPFGPDGPKNGWVASDLTLMAAGCQLSITGDEDRAPVRTAAPQAWLHAGAEAAVGALLALTERERSGLGQHVEVSAQIAVMQAAVPAMLAAPHENPPVRRMAGGLWGAGVIPLLFVYPAKDGHVSILLLFGAMIGPFSRRLVDWAYELGLCDKETRDLDWIHFLEDLVIGKYPIEKLAHVQQVVAEFTASMTKAELFAGAKERRLLLAPVMTLPELLESEQLAARSYWIETDDPALPAVARCPGDYVRMDGLTALRRAPRLGEHTAEILGALPAAPTTKPETPTPADALSRRRLPLEGLKVVDFTWVYAGPLMTRLLADFGATVIKVESSTRPDPTRGGGPAINGDRGSDGAAGYSHFNAGKLGFALNMSVPEAKDVLHDLVAWADVVVESFTPGVLDEWGFGYEAMRAINPGVVLLSTCLMGQTGPLADFAGFGNLAAAVTGFYDLTGWPDRIPAGPFLAYTDYIAPRFAIAALLAALDERRRTNLGRHIDLSQAEASIHFLTPAILDAQLNGNVLSRMGNADIQFHPHGIYPTVGPDDWIAIACETEAHRVTLAGLLGVPADQLDDERIAGYTRACDKHELTHQLQALGVPAHWVANSAEAWTDEQLHHLGHWLTVAHPVHPSVVVEGPRQFLSETPGRVVRGGPSLGEHLDIVTREFLGYDDDRIGALLAAGAFE